MATRHARNTGSHFLQLLQRRLDLVPGARSRGALLVGGLLLRQEQRVLVRQGLYQG